MRKAYFGESIISVVFWEDMCHTFSFKELSDKNLTILYADTNIKINNKHVANLNLDKYHKIYAQNTDKNNYPFYIQFRDKKRFLRPDLVIRVQEKEVSLFDKENIKIILKDTNISNFKDISLKLNNPCYEKEFKGLIHNIKTLIKVKRLQARAKTDTSFTTYPIDELKRQKDFILQKFYLINTPNICLIDFKYHDITFITK